MTELEVRRPPFAIDETVPFQWQPANPAFGLFGNVFTFLAIAFERYLVAATRRAAPRFTDEELAREADAFVRQEAQHARAHRAHARALISQHPGLQQTFDATTAAYDDLLEREDDEFHLAYVANLEATFTPLFKVVFDNRGPLFVGGDERIGTLLLWHFYEEIEHRSSALRIHRHVTPDPRYRLRHARRVFDHVATVYGLVVDGFEEHVPLEVRLVPASTVAPSGLWLGEVASRTPVVRRRRQPSMLAHVPGADLRSMIWRLARSQAPRHDPATEALPAWADRWRSAFDAGADVTTYAGLGL